MKNSRKTLALIGGFGAGAATMYIFDPARGRRRRAVAFDSLGSSFHQLRDATNVALRDLANRARGVGAEAWGSLHHEQVSDSVLEQRVRSKLGRVSSHPAAILVAAEKGSITLRGTALTDEADRIISSVASMRGVLNINNQLELHNTPNGVPDLQGGLGRSGKRFQLLQKNWAPANRLLAGSAGAFLAVSGLKRRGMPGALLGFAGLTLLARAASNMEIASLVGRKGAQPIHLQKTIHVSAPVEEVYGFWQNLVNLPRIMDHVYSVEPIDHIRHRWTVAGPVGLPLKWNSAITLSVPNKVIGWRSEPGSIVQSSGVVRFDSESGGTRVHVRMSYNPPGGAIGHAMAMLLGADPKHLMDDDLGRFKSLMEIGKTHAHGRPVKKEKPAS